MDEKNKILAKLVVLGFGVFVSVCLLFYIIISQMNFANIGLRLYSNNIMNEFAKENGNEVYSEFIDNYDITVDQFIKEQDKINSLLGSIVNYKFTEFSQNDIGIVSKYTVEYEKYPKNNMILNWVFVRDSKKWKIADYSILTNQDTLLKINNMKKKSGDSSNYSGIRGIDVNKAEEFGDSIIEKYMSGQYDEIYSLGTEKFKENGSQNDFSSYLSRTENKTEGGSCNLIDYSYGNDKQEIALKYQIDVESKESSEFMIWAREEGNQICLSGFTSQESGW